MLVVALVTTGCNRDKKAATSDSSTLASPRIPASQPASANTGWDDASAGPVMLLAAAGDDPSNVALVLPRQTDSTLSAIDTFHLASLSNLPVDLFDAAGSAGQSALVVSSQKLSGDGCVAWPAARLASRPSVLWKVGFLKGKATAIRIDSIEGMSPADSSMVTIELARIASAISVNGDPVFQGLPFIVQKAYRLWFDNNSVLVGSIVRKINEEANPRQEQLLLLAERSDASGGKYAASFRSRSSGSEDAVRTNRILAAVRFVQLSRPALILSFEYDDGGQVALLERVADHDWRITWRSAYTGC